MKRPRGRSNRQVTHQEVHLPEAFLEGCLGVSLELEVPGPRGFPGAGPGNVDMSKILNVSA